ncbi:S8 family serine peptidase [Halovivax limisalsi]|uniref:S8 family serine peptidase n=1 Tax=Halovivax limisalsi TaxID=1453760 RepID=UPI001FFCE1BA|nr:S8 family serine peptidase [Halovivax limisalsi]
MRLSNTQLLAVLFAALLAGTMFVPLGAATHPLSSADDAATDAASVHESLSNASGETQLHLVLPDVPAVERRGGPDAVVSALQSTAERTQEPVIEAVERYDAVTVEATYWIRNSVFVTADLDEIDLETLAAIDGVERIEPRATIETPKPVAENPDPEPTDDHVTWGLDAINAPDVWEEFGVTGEGARVVVADTGVDPTHPDIDLAEEDGWLDPAQGSDTPEYSNDHGTHVSGTVAGGNASGTAIGVAPGVELAHARVLGGDGTGPDPLVEAFEWAVETDSDVISMSLSGQTTGMYSEVVYNTMDAGTLVVSSMGNNGEGTAGEPGSGYDTVGSGSIAENLAVTGTSGGDKLTESDFGDNYLDHWPDGGYIKPDLAAPGFLVLSAVPGGEYEEKAGTSMSTPHKAGTAALIFSANPDLTAWEVKDIMMETAWKPDDWDPNEAQHYNPDTGRDSRYGVGIVDAYAAVERAGEPEPAEFDVSIDGTNAPVTEGDELVVDATVENVGGESGDETIELADFDGAVVDSRSVSLEAGASTTVELTWNTDVGDAGSGEVTVSSENDTASAAVEIEPDESDPGCERPGDVDGDGEVNSLDATKTQQHIAGLDPGTFDENCADLTDDGAITPADVTAIHQAIVGFAA